MGVRRRGSSSHAGAYHTRNLSCSICRTRPVPRKMKESYKHIPRSTHGGAHDQQNQAKTQQNALTRTSWRKAASCQLRWLIGWLGSIVKGGPAGTCAEATMFVMHWEERREERGLPSNNTCKGGQASLEEKHLASFCVCVWSVCEPTCFGLSRGAVARFAGWAQNESRGKAACRRAADNFQKAGAGGVQCKEGPVNRDR